MAAGSALVHLIPGWADLVGECSCSGPVQLLFAVQKVASLLRFAERKNQEQTTLTLRPQPLNPNRLQPERAALHPSAF